MVLKRGKVSNIFPHEVKFNDYLQTKFFFFL